MSIFGVLDFCTRQAAITTEWWPKLRRCKHPYTVALAKAVGDLAPGQLRFSHAQLGPQTIAETPRPPTISRSVHIHRRGFRLQPDHQDSQAGTVCGFHPELGGYGRPFVRLEVLNRNHATYMHPTVKGLSVCSKDDDKLSVNAQQACLHTLCFVACISVCPPLWVVRRIYTRTGQLCGATHEGCSIEKRRGPINP